MKIRTNDLITRLAGLVLAIGFFYGCSSTLPELNKARINLDKQRYDKALTSVNKEIKAHPGNPEAYYIKGNILFELALDQKQPANRLSYYKEMRQTLLQSRKLYVDSLDSQQSVEINNIDDLLRNGWRNEYEAGMRLMESDSLSADDATREALAHFDNATTLLPDSTKPYHYKARLLYRQGNNEAAINTLTSVLKKNKRPATSTLEQLAYLYLRTGSPEQATALYEEALNRNIDNTNLIHGLVNAYIQEGNHRSAVRLLDTLAQRNPRNTTYKLSFANELYQLAGTHLDSIQTFSDQRKRFKASNDSDEDLDESYNQAVNKQWNAARSLLDRARRQYAAADSLSPGEAETTYSIGIFYKNMALDIKEVAPLLPDTVADDLDQQTDSYLKSAISYLEEAVNQMPEHQGYWEQLYQLYSHFGMGEKAQEARERANL